MFTYCKVNIIKSIIADLERRLLLIVLSREGVGRGICICSKQLLTTDMIISNILSVWVNNFSPEKGIGGAGEESVRRDLY